MIKTKSSVKTVCAIVVLIVFTREVGSQVPSPVETVVNFKITFESPEVYSFDDSVALTSKNHLNNREEWRKQAVCNPFSACIVYLWDIIPEEKEFSLEAFTVLPVLWSATNDDKAILPMKYSGLSDIKNVSLRIREAYIMKITNTKTNRDYFLCICDGINEYWLPTACATLDHDISLHSLLHIESSPNKNTLAQIDEYLRLVDFGPNNWSGERCMALTVFLSEPDRELFTFPIVTEHLKKKRRQKLEFWEADKFLFWCPSPRFL